MIILISQIFSTSHAYILKELKFEDSKIKHQIHVVFKLICFKNSAIFYNLAKQFIQYIALFILKQSQKQLQ